MSNIQYPISNEHMDEELSPHATAQETKTSEMFPEMEKSQPLVLPAQEVPVVGRVPEIGSADTGHAEPALHVSSKRRWFRVALVVAICNPIPSGLIVGMCLWREKEMQKEGKLVTAVSLVAGALLLLFIYRITRAML